MRYSLLILSVLAIVSAAQATTLDQYLDALAEHHPLFKSEDLSVKVEEERQAGLLGREDWLLTATPSYEYNEPVDQAFSSPYETRNAMLDVGISRSFWSSGGKLDLGYTYDNQQTRTANSTVNLGGGQVVNVARPPQFFANAATLSYRQPLLKNRGGKIDSLQYDIQGYTAEQTKLLALENEEGFLLRMGLRFLDWILVTEELRIGQHRLDLALEDKKRSQDKYDENVIEKVDLLRAEDAVYTTEQALKRVESYLAATRAELEGQAYGKIDLSDAPVYDLNGDVEQIARNDIDTEVIASLRMLRVLDLRMAQLEREQSGLLDNKKAELDLLVFGNLKDGAEEYSDAVGFDSPGVGVALSYSRPVNNRSARSDYQRAALEAAKVSFDREAIRLDLETGAYSLIAEMKSLREVLEINKKQIETAANKTKEEQLLYDQGRNQFTFVLQSQDDEARAQLEFARNAVSLRKLALRLDAVLDRIIEEK